jgi:hypothetical protein
VIPAASTINKKSHPFGWLCHWWWGGVTHIMAAKRYLALILPKQK